MENSQKKQDDFLDKVIDFIEELEEEEVAVFTSILIRTTIDYGTRNHLESVGLLQSIMLDIHDDFNEEIKDTIRRENALKN